MGWAAQVLRRGGHDIEADTHHRVRLDMARRMIEAALGENGLDIAETGSLEAAYALADRLQNERVSANRNPVREAEVRLRHAERMLERAREGLRNKEREAREGMLVTSAALAEREALVAHWETEVRTARREHYERVQGGLAAVNATHEGSDD